MFLFVSCNHLLYSKTPKTDQLKAPLSPFIFNLIKESFGGKKKNKRLTLSSCKISEMAGFHFRHFLLHRSQIKGESRCLRAMRVKLARKRRVNRRASQSLRALYIAAAEFQRWNWRIRGENEAIFAANTLINQLVHDLLLEIENDP
ncbi:hypothetical protein DITRI_Ditri06bG0134100 [Diplodiscus trichospermus]